MNAFAKVGARKQDVQWPGGVKREYGRLEKPPTVEAKVSKAPATSTFSSPNSISVPQPTKGSSWGSSSPNKSSGWASSNNVAPSKPAKAWGTSSEETPSKPSWGTQTSAPTLTTGWGSNSTSSAPKKPWSKNEVASTSADFRPNITLKTEGADFSISLPTNVSKVDYFLTFFKKSNLKII